MTALTATACGSSTDAAASPDSGGTDGGSPDGGAAGDSTSPDGGTDSAVARDDGGTGSAISDGGGGACTDGGGLPFDFSIDSTNPVYLSGSQPPWPTSLGCPGWLTITTAAGQPLVVSRGDCFVGCPAAQPKTAAPESFTWDGTYYPVQASCTGPSCSCTTPACAPAGNYVATFCVGYAGPDAGMSAAPPPTCQQVSFAWPPSSGASPISETIIPTPDGG